MIIAAFSDLHGNQYAFRALTKSLAREKFDKLVFCGDVFGYYYGQSEIITGMREWQKRYGMLAVKGNHDLMAEQVLAGTIDAESLYARYGHSYGKLCAQDVEFTQRLPERICFEADGLKVGVVHGALQDPLNGRIYPRDEVADTEACQSFDIVLCGHTHFRMQRQVGRCWLINAGSAGQQRDGKGCCYVVVDTVRKTAAYRELRFDLAPLEDEIKQYDPQNEKMIAILHRTEADVY